MVDRAGVLAAIEANPNFSNRQLALQLQVDHKTVGRVRATLIPNPDAPPTHSAGAPSATAGSYAEPSPEATEAEVDSIIPAATVRPAPPRTLNHKGGTMPGVRILRHGLTCCGEVLKKEQIVPNPCATLLRLAQPGELHLGQQVAELVDGSSDVKAGQPTHGFPSVRGKIAPRRV